MATVARSHAASHLGAQILHAQVSPGWRRRRVPGTTLLTRSVRVVAGRLRFKQHAGAKQVPRTAAVFRANYYRRSRPAVLGRMASEKARLKSNEQWTSSEIPFV